jgi:hypothetical protein
MRVIKPKPNGKSRNRKTDYWDDKQTEKTVYVLEIEHDSRCDRAALAAMFEGGAQGNIKQIKVIHHGS